MPEIKKSVSKRFFIGSNTSDGFVSFGSEVFERLLRIYIIKGGPGCGKSTFMKTVASSAEEAGLEVERYYCSSDENSLDAVVIPELSIAVTDGTAPHVYEAKYIGAKETYLDLSEFLNTDFLSLLLKEIKRLTDLKGERYRALYKCLSIAEYVKNEREKLLSDCYDYEKAKKAADRLLKALGNGSGFSLATRQVSAFGMNGSAYLDTYERLAEEKWTVSDKRGVSPFLFSAILDAAKERSLKTFISYDRYRRPEALLFPEKSVCVLLNREDVAEKIINTERFIVKEIYREKKKRLRFLSSVEDELSLAAQDNLYGAKEFHFKLESIYSEAMDFEALNLMTEAFIKEKIIGR